MLHAYVAATDTWSTLATLRHHAHPVLALQFAPLEYAPPSERKHHHNDDQFTLSLAQLNMTRACTE